MATKRFQCPKDEFWDLGTDRCEPCSSICENAVQTGFGDFCREMCPAYANAIWDITGGKSTPAVENNDNSGLSPEIIAAIAVGISAFVALAVIVLIIVKRKRDYRDRIPVPVVEQVDQHRIQQETPDGFRGTSDFVLNTTDCTEVKISLGSSQPEASEMPVRCI
ncbi:hypothetical protein C0Q70_00097 [Pomacea canaliculata]|uniref:Uncharacterized protein n=2 Tax=Pomacea canaliculata TaxID=400727 RepID=A0A2T7PVQ7_POMCA|nr:hypothetical protein C0Q70_00097 [Pomacea canaliculata]